MKVSKCSKLTACRIAKYPTEMEIEGSASEKFLIFQKPFTVPLWFSGESGRPSVGWSAVRSPAPLVHVDVSLGKTLHSKIAPASVPMVNECVWMLVTADVQVEP